MSKAIDDTNPMNTSSVSNPTPYNLISVSNSTSLGISQNWLEFPQTSIENVTDIVQQTKRQTPLESTSKTTESTPLSFNTKSLEIGTKCNRKRSLEEKDSANNARCKIFVKSKSFDGKEGKGKHNLNSITTNNLLSKTSEMNTPKIFELSGPKLLPNKDSESVESVAVSNAVIKQCPLPNFQHSRRKQKFPFRSASFVGKENINPVLGHVKNLEGISRADNAAFQTTGLDNRKVTPLMPAKRSVQINFNNSKIYESSAIPETKEINVFSTQGLQNNNVGGLRSANVRNAKEIASVYPQEASTAAQNDPETNLKNFHPPGFNGKKVHVVSRFACTSGGNVIKTHQDIVPVYSHESTSAKRFQKTNSGALNQPVSNVKNTQGMKSLYSQKTCMPTQKFPKTDSKISYSSESKISNVQRTIPLHSQAVSTPVQKLKKTNLGAPGFIIRNMQGSVPLYLHSESMSAQNLQKTNSGLSNQAVFNVRNTQRMAGLYSEKTFSPKQRFPKTYSKVSYTSGSNIRNDQGMTPLYTQAASTSTQNLQKTNLGVANASRSNMRNIQGQICSYSHAISTSAQNLQKSNSQVVHVPGFNTRNVQGMAPLYTQAVSIPAQNFLLTNSGIIHVPGSNVINVKGMIPAYYRPMPASAQSLHQTNSRNLHMLGSSLKNAQGNSSYSHAVSTSEQKLQNNNLGAVPAPNMKCMNGMTPIHPQAVSASEESLPKTNSRNSQPSEFSKPKEMVPLNSQISSMYNAFKSLPMAYGYNHHRPLLDLGTPNKNSLNFGMHRAAQQGITNFQVPVSIAPRASQAIQLGTVYSTAIASGIFKQTNGHLIQTPDDLKQTIDSTNFKDLQKPLLVRPVKLVQCNSAQPIPKVSKTVGKPTESHPGNSAVSDKPLKDNRRDEIEASKHSGAGQKIQETQQILTALSMLLTNMDRTLSNGFECSGIETFLPIWKSELQVFNSSVEEIRSILSEKQKRINMNLRVQNHVD